MTLKETLAQLEAWGTEQNRKIYRRHGADERVYGVSYANLYALQKKIKRDHALALQLWDSGWGEARVLACFIADPAQGDEALLNRWAGEVGDYGIADAFGDYAAQCEAGRRLARKWIKASGEMVQRCGWNTLGVALKEGRDGLSDKGCVALIADIEKRIHKAPNRAREGMLWALIALGSYRAAVREQVLEAAARIGPVDIDHGQTSCKTPDAAAYIRKVVDHQAKRAAKA